MKTTDSDTLGELRVTNPADADACNARYVEDGYLFFRTALEANDVLRAKRDMIRVLQQQGLVKDGRSDPVWTGAGYDRIDDHPLYALESCADLFGTAPMVRLLEQVFGEPVFVTRCMTIRFAFPHDLVHVSAAHQDGFYVPGITELRTLWVPLMMIDRCTAPLAVAVGSHKTGARKHIEQTDLESYILKGRKQSGVDWRHEYFDWLTAEFEAGDVLMFHRHTVHRALPNRSDRIRISLDTRCHPKSILPTFQNQKTILELREYRDRALDMASALGVSQDDFEMMILEMMKRGTPVERGPMLAIKEELAG